jgi:PsbP
MNAWKEIRQEVLDPIRKVGSNSKLKRKSKSKSKKEITPQETFALIASIIIIIISFGGIGLVYNVFAQSQNQNLTSTYENKEQGFAFDYPATWHNEFDANEARLNNYVVALADPFSNDTDGIERVIFRVNVSDVHKSLDSDLQIRSDTPEDYVRNTIDYVNESQYQTNAAIKEATSYEESDKPLWTLENLKNNTIKISGENASRVHYVESYGGEQKVFTIFIFVVKDDKVYELNFYTGEPLKVPETLPIAEKIFKSFRFT